MQAENPEIAYNKLIPKETQMLQVPTKVIGKNEWEPILKLIASKLQDPNRSTQELFQKMLATLEYNCEPEDAMYG